MNFNITAGTIARTAVLLLALTNQMLSAMGKSPLPIESTTVEQLVTACRMVEEQLLYEGSHCGRQGV